MFVCMFFKLLAFPSILPSLQSNDNSLPINLFFIQLFLYYHNLKYTISNLSFFYNPILNSIIPIITTINSFTNNILPYFYSHSSNAYTSVLILLYILTSYHQTNKSPELYFLIGECENIKIKVEN